MGCSSSKGASSPLSSASSNASVQPEPVFVIKTTNEATEEKLFINILVVKDKDTNDAISSSSVMIGDVRSDTDKRNHQCQIVDFVCSNLVVEYPSKAKKDNNNYEFNNAIQLFTCERK